MTSLQKKETKEEKYKTSINGWFQYIGKKYDKTLIMSYKLNNGSIIYVEPLNTFTSLNFVIKILTKIPEKYYIKLLTKKQAIVFIRVVQQYLTRRRNQYIRFIDPTNIPDEYAQSNEAMWSTEKDNINDKLEKNIKQIIDVLM